MLQKIEILLLESSCVVLLILDPSQKNEFEKSPGLYWRIFICWSVGICWSSRGELGLSLVTETLVDTIYAPCTCHPSSFCGLTEMGIGWGLLWHGPAALLRLEIAESSIIPHFLAGPGEYD